MSDAGEELDDGVDEPAGVEEWIADESQEAALLDRRGVAPPEE